MSQTSDYGSDRVDQADASQALALQQAHARSTAPIAYRILYISGGREVFDTFESPSRERAATMRTRFGINADNVKWALQSRTSEGRWSEPIGDKGLGSKLKSKR